jgi:DNA-binding IscR family transcriptional regulator
MEVNMIKPIHYEIIQYLTASGATFDSPQSSAEIGSMLNVTPSYVRLMVKGLLVKGKVRVRRGRGGGYYLR